MTTDLITLIDEWRAAHPKAWPKGAGLHTSPSGPSYIDLEMDYNEPWEQAAALALIADAVLDELMERDGVLSVEFHPIDDMGEVSVCINRFGCKRNCWGDAPVRLHALLLAERAMREGT